ncbi:MAG: hypothetical protein WBF77_11445 [Sulfurimonadaceae bacterium]
MATKFDRPITQKSFAYIFVLFLTLFAIFHLTMWNLYTKRIFELPENMKIGDLSRLSYKTDSIQLRERRTPHHHNFFTFSNWDGQPVDLLTIGDSYSNGAVGEFYQDHLAATQNLRVMNIQQLPFTKNYLETIVLLLNSGVLGTIKPRSILIESVERECMNRFSTPINTAIKADYNTTIESLQKTHYISKNQPPIRFVNTANYNAFLYKLLYMFDDNAYYSPVYITPLKQAFFSSEDAHSLLFINNDIEGVKKTTSRSVNKMNQSLNSLTDLLQKRNISLYFMPVVDKSNLYAPYIVENQYPASTFFETLRAMPRRYSLIDTKQILTKQLEMGKHDIFYPDDTHWSRMSNATVMSQTAFYKPISE